MNANDISPSSRSLTGIFFLMVGPSGVGKGTIIAELKKQLGNNNQYHFPVTATTRLPREGEVDGKDYFFLTKEQFESGIKKNEFLEYATVHGENYYGLPKKEVEDALQDGKIVIRELDIQGLWNLEKILPKESLHSIFLLPPSMKILEQRIRGRSPLPEEEIARRLKSAQMEIENSKDCDSTVVSEDNNISQTVINIKNIFAREMAIKQKI